MPLPPTIEAAAALGWIGLRITCSKHGTRSVPWSRLAPDGNRRVSLNQLIDKLKACQECHDHVELQSATGAVEIHEGDEVLISWVPINKDAP